MIIKNNCARRYVKMNWSSNLQRFYNKAKQAIYFNRTENYNLSESNYLKMEYIICSNIFKKKKSASSACSGSYVAPSLIKY